MANVLVHIPRPNQGFHVGFGLISAFSLAYEKEDMVDVLICNDANAECPVKTFFEKTMYHDSCNDCDTMIHDIDAAIKTFNSNLGKNNPIGIHKSADYIDSYQLDPIKIENELSSFKSKYNAIGESDTFSGEFSDSPWISELCTLSSVTAYDIANSDKYDYLAKMLIGLAVRIESLAESFLRCKNYEKYIVYNGRHTAAKSFWQKFRKLNTYASCFIHEIGLYQDSFSLLNGVSNEDHFEMLPIEYFPKGIAKTIINDLKGEIAIEKSAYYNYLNYMVGKLDGKKNFYGNVVPIKYKNEGDLPVRKDSKSILFLLSSYDEVSIPYPIDRVLYEQVVVPLMIDELQLRGYNIYIRLHPRSNPQLKNSQSINGSYYQFVQKLEKLSQSRKVHLFLPTDKTSSYDLMRRCRLVISLFSIAALEAQSLGCLSLVHARCRGNHSASGRITSLSKEGTLNALNVWLDNTKQLLSSKDYMVKARIAARNFLGNDLSNFTYYIPGFKNFSPFLNWDWHKGLRQFTISDSYYDTKEIQDLLSKFDEPARSLD